MVAVARKLAVLLHRLWVSGEAAFAVFGAEAYGRVLAENSSVMVVGQPIQTIRRPIRVVSKSRQISL